MTSFKDRDKGFENKFAHDAEATFKINARRSKLLALWAAGRLRKSGADAEQYAKNIVQASVGGGDAIVERLLKDFGHAGIDISPKEIHAEMDRLTALARQQILGDEAF